MLRDIRTVTTAFSDTIQIWIAMVTTALKAASAIAFRSATLLRLSNEHHVSNYISKRNSFHTLLSKLLELRSVLLK